MGLLDKIKITKRDKKASVQEAKVSDKKGGQSMKELYEEKPSSAKVPTFRKAKVGIPTASVGTTEDKKIEKIKYGNAYKILVRPLVTEKASILGAESKYFFEVSPKANKIEIAKAIQDVYGVKPVSINIIKMKGKNVRYGRMIGKRKGWKKAIVTLREGESIKVYEGV